MRVCTVFGTRPEIIRLSEIIKVLDRFSEQLLVHTGQNHDPRLSDVFFRDLELRQPDVHLGVAASSFAEQAGQILARAGEAFTRQRPDRILILGDTNSALAALVGWAGAGRNGLQRPAQGDDGDRSPTDECAVPESCHMVMQGKQRLPSNPTGWSGAF